MKNQKNSNVIETTGNTATSKADADLEKPRNYRMKVNPLKISPSTVIIKPQLKEVVEKEVLSGQTNGIERSQSLHHDNSTVAATKEVDDNARGSGEATGKVIPVVEENFDLTKKTVLH
jgi:hypothetical protein